MRKRPLINRGILELIEDVNYVHGMIDADKLQYSKPFKRFDYNFNLYKLIYEGSALHIGPGSKVEVYWEMFDGPDVGYIFTLPGWDSGDIYMSGIVHIPKPQGCEKSECDPEWYHFERLLDDEYVTKVVVKEQ